MSPRPTTPLQPLQLFTIAFGTIVGITWVFLSGPWLRAAGSLGTVMALMLGATCILPIAWCYACLAESYPGAGGELLYVGRTLGILPGLLAGWLLAFSYIALVAFHFVTVAWLMDIGLTHVGFALGHPVTFSRMAGIAVSALVFAGIVIANLRGMQVAARFQDLVVALLVIATLGFALNAFRLGRIAYLAPYVVQAEGWPYGGILSVLATAPFLFGGFGTAVQAVFADSYVRPRMMFPVLGWAVAAAAIFYALIILSISAALPREQLLGYPLPALDAFSGAFHSPLATASVTALALVALCTSWNGVFLAGWRIVSALAGVGLLPSSLSSRSDRGIVAYRSILLVSVLSVLATVRGRSGLLGIVNSVAFLIAVIFLLMAGGTLRHLMRSSVRAAPARTIRIWIAILAVGSGLAAALLASHNLQTSPTSSFDVLLLTACALTFLLLAVIRRAQVTASFSDGTA